MRKSGNPFFNSLLVRQSLPVAAACYFSFDGSAASQTDSKQPALHVATGNDA
jgi:hypothetical protein